MNIVIDSIKEFFGNYILIRKSVNYWLFNIIILNYKKVIKTWWLCHWVFYLGIVYGNFRFNY